MRYYLEGVSSQRISEILSSLYEEYPCNEGSYDDYLFVVAFNSLSGKLHYIDDLETLQLIVLLNGVDRFGLVYKDSHEYIKFLTRLLEEV